MRANSIIKVHDIKEHCTTDVTELAEFMYIFFAVTGFVGHGANNDYFMKEQINI